VGGTETSRGVEPATNAIGAQAAAGNLPRTGTNATSLAGTAFALLLSGLGLRRIRPRRTAH
jgi:LPXTG-motif cell wall-anchored protein